jgi:integrase
VKLDAKSITGLVLPDGKNEIVYWDDELPKFGLRLRRGDGRTLKTWVAQYRVSGKVAKATFGDARVVSPSEARAAARKHLAEVSLGADPQAERAAKRRAAQLTFAKVAEAYLEDCQRRMRPNSYKTAKLYLTRPHYFKPLHAKGVSEVTFTDIAACVRNIESTRSANVAGCARNILCTFFSWAISEGLLGRDPRNPVIGTRIPQGSPPRDRVLSDDELVAIWRATEDDGSYAGRPCYRDNWRNFCSVIRLLLLLGARLGEIANMAWSELDLAAGTWTLPKERSQNKRALILALPKAALDILAAVPRQPEVPYVFGSRQKTQQAAMYASYRLKDVLDERLGNRVGPWHTHDLRRTAATHMADLGIFPHVIEAALNHVSGTKSGVAGIYNRSTYDREVTAALARWSEHLLALVEGRAGANVVPLRGAS